MSKILAALAFATGALFLANAANATPVTFNVTLTASVPGSSPVSGIGSFTIDNYTGTGPELFTYQDPSHPITAMSFDIDGQHFDLSNLTVPAAGIYASFFNGSLQGLTYLGTTNPPDNTTSLTVGALSYIYGSVTPTYHYSIGDISVKIATTPTAPAPEPMTIALLGAGLAGLGFRRRKAA